MRGPDERLLMTAGFQAVQALKSGHRPQTIDFPSIAFKPRLEVPVLPEESCVVPEEDHHPAGKNPLQEAEPLELRLHEHPRALKCEKYALGRYATL